MKKQLITIAMVCGLFTGFTATAAEGLDDVTMEISKKEFKRGHKMGFPAHEVVVQYMLEKGDITQAEVDAMKAEKKANREALKALKDAGDKEGFKAKLAEIKEQGKARREQLKEYIENHEDLKAAIKERKAQMKEEHKRRREERRENKEGSEG